MNIGRKALTDAEFLVLWASIEREMHKLAVGGLCNASQIYNCIYIICTSPSSKFEEKLYWKIGDFIYMRCKEIRREIFESSEWVEAYNVGFRRFKEMVFAINELCDFLNECVSGRKMKDFGFLLWERCVLQQTVKYKQTTLGFELVNNSRIELVREAIESLRLIISDPNHPMLYYTQRYEQLALQRLRAKYEEEIDSMNVDVEAYSSYVRDKMVYERSIRGEIFLEESWPKVEAVLEEVFILNKRSYLYEEMYKTICMHQIPVEMLGSISRCSNGELLENDLSTELTEKTVQQLDVELVSSHPTNDFYELQKPNASCAPGQSERFCNDMLEKASVLYKNLSWLGSAYDILKSAFVQYISTECERHMHVYERSTESLYLFYCMLRNVVEIGFMADPEYFKILKKEFSAVCTRLKPSLEARLIDFSEAIVGDDSSTFVFLDKKAIFTGDDEQIDGTKIHMSRPFDGAVEEFNSLNDKGIALQRVFTTLYKLIEKRQEFYEMYSVRLSKRLLERTSDLHKEKMLIMLMKRKGNQDFVRKAETMISDINISLHYNKDASRFVWMLTQAYWPVQMEELSIRVPKSLDMIRKAYEFKFSKKKLHWAWHLGHVSVDILGHEVVMNVLQYSVMDLFNRYGKITLDLALDEVKAGTRMTEDILKSLVEGSLLAKTGDDYRMNRSMEGLEPDMMKFYRKENVETVHEIDRNTYYQSLVSLILKKNRKMELSDIVEEVKLKHTGYFEYDETLFDESMRVLVDKGITEEADQFYMYLP